MPLLSGFRILLSSRTTQFLGRLVGGHQPVRAKGAPWFCSIIREDCPRRHQGPASSSPNSRHSPSSAFDNQLSVTNSESPTSTLHHRLTVLCHDSYPQYLLCVSHIRHLLGSTLQRPNHIYTPSSTDLFSAYLRLRPDLLRQTERVFDSGRLFLQGEAHHLPATERRRPSPVLALYRRQRAQGHAPSPRLRFQSGCWCVC